MGRPVQYDSRVTPQKLWNFERHSAQLITSHYINANKYRRDSVIVTSSSLWSLLLLLFYLLLLSLILLPPPPPPLAILYHY